MQSIEELPAKKYDLIFTTYDKVKDLIDIYSDLAAFLMAKGSYVIENLSS